MLEFYKDKTILITGDTGFKGSWLSLMLIEAGAHVIGISNPEPRNNDTFYKLAEINKHIQHYDIDIRDYESLSVLFNSANIDIVFHLAAQPLVKESYRNPLDTFDINVRGAINIMECIRNSKTVKSFVLVTTDKVYKDQSWLWGYRESDELGGADPYAASKSMIEQAFYSYQSSFFTHMEIGTATARGGNVIGGGDFSIDRIIPDCYRNLIAGNSVILRNPDAIRPWQHVLDLLYGYLLLAKKIYEKPYFSGSAWNFGPDVSSHITVKSIVEMFLKIWGSGAFIIDQYHGEQKESVYLLLDSSKSHRLLKWDSNLTISTTIKLTADWYRQVMVDKQPAFDVSIKQIREYLETEVDS